MMDTDAKKILHDLVNETSSSEFCLPNRLDLPPEKASKGLVQLALTIVNLIKEVMEKQAMRKMEKGQLSDEQIENLGNTFLLLDLKMTELQEHFGLNPEDLQLDLGQLMDVRNL